MPSKGHTRDSSLELYRILVMLLIVAHHAVVNSGLKAVIENQSVTSNGLLLLLLGAWGKIGINCFVLITGYFMCKKDISINKFFRLYGQVVFYGVVCNLLFVVTGYATLDWRMVVDTIFPFTELTWNFVSAFLVFYLLIPFLNVIVRNISQRQHAFLLGVCLLFLSILPCIHRYHVNFNYVEWFCVLYFVGSYLRLYPVRLLEDKRISSALLVLSVIVIGVSIWAFAIPLKGRLPSVYGIYFFAEDSNKITALLPAVFAFCLFKNLKLPYSPIINRIAATCFGVLLIHANSMTMHYWLWNHLTDVKQLVGTSNGILLLIAAVLIVFACCVLIELSRRSVVMKFGKEV